VVSSVRAPCFYPLFKSSAAPKSCVCLARPPSAVSSSPRSPICRGQFRRVAKQPSCGRLSLTATNLISADVGRIIPRIKAFASIPVSIFSAVCRTCIHPTGGQSAIGRGRVNLGIGCNYDIGWSRRGRQRLRRYCVRLRSIEIGLCRVGIRLRGVGASLITIPWAGGDGGRRSS